MENLMIQGTRSTPEVDFNVNGNLTMKGRILTENILLFFNPLIDWVSNLECESVNFEIQLEYINTGAAMQLFSILRKLEENSKIKNLTVKWYYEEDDEDHLETGEMFEDKLNRTKFVYLEDTEQFAA